MAIPKKIHYCWFGGNPLPDEAKKCIRSWKRHCPDYEIIQWDEGNFDVNCNAYCRQAYENKKWAFVTDYARLWILYHYGGVYFDTDVKVIKSFDKFLKHPCFVGIEKSKLYVNVNTGVGMGAEQGNEVVKALLNSYENIPFIVNGKQDITTCTVRNTEVLKQFGYQHEDAFQQLQGIAVYPSEYFSPMDMESGIIYKTKNTHSIHLYNLSWTSAENQKKRKAYVKKAQRRNRVYHLKTLPNRFLIKVFGKRKYSNLKNKFK